MQQTAGMQQTAVDAADGTSRLQAGMGAEPEEQAVMGRGRCTAQ